MTDLSSVTPQENNLKTDGREQGNWRTRYPEPEAQAAIKYEKNYILRMARGNLFLFILLCILFEYCNSANITPVSKVDFYQNLEKYIFAALGGNLGGTIFSIKWLIHSIAKNTWNRDRRLWRIFTPIVSGLLGFTVIILLSTNIITLAKLDCATMYKCYGIAFLVGYFSDNAISKFTEIAQVFFGSSMGQKK